MRFLSIYKGVETGQPPTQEEMTRMGALIEKFMKSGELVATEGCLPSALGVRVRKDGTKITLKGRPVHRGQGSCRGICHSRSALEGARHRAGERVPRSCRGRRMRDSPDLRRAQIKSGSGKSGSGVIFA